MNLLLIAPEIQGEIIHLPKVPESKDPIHEKLLRPVTAEVCFQEQCEMWTTINERVQQSLPCRPG